jgi:hypothetical protein
MRFPERRGWFVEYFSEMRGWSEVPATFRDWAKLELSATRLHAWSPGVLHGLLQAASGSSLVLVRDTTDRAGHTLSVPAAAWRSFIIAVRVS